jgi:hypothetical protein
MLSVVASAQCLHWFKPDLLCFNCHSLSFPFGLSLVGVFPNNSICNFNILLIKFSTLQSLLYRFPNGWQGNAFKLQSLNETHVLLSLLACDACHLTTHKHTIDQVKRTTHVLEDLFWHLNSIDSSL